MMIFWGGTNPSDVSIDTTNNEEMMAGSHITYLHTHEYEESVPPELLNKVPNVPEVCDLAHKCHLNPSDKSKDSNMLHDSLSVQYRSNGLISINTISQQQDRPSTRWYKGG